jgi:uncharacterized membrane protein
MASVVHSVKFNMFRYLDAWASDKHPRYTTFRSWVGAVLTLLAVGLFVVWVVVTINTLASGVPNVIEYSVAEDGSPVNMSNLLRLGLRVRMERFGGDGRNLLQSPDVLGWSIVHRTKRNQTVVSSVPLDEVPCQLGLGDPSIKCFRPELLQGKLFVDCLLIDCCCIYRFFTTGSWEEATYDPTGTKSHSYIKIVFWFCSQNTSIDWCSTSGVSCPAKRGVPPPVVQCQPQDEIIRQLRLSEFNILM